jgi:hypothetical protein
VKKSGTIKKEASAASVYFDKAEFNKTLIGEGYVYNTFLINLLENAPFPFSASDVSSVAKAYQVGTITSDYMKGAASFPFIDIDDNVRAIQVKQFNERNNTIKTSFLHKIIESEYKKKALQLPEWLQKYSEQEKKVSCLFGEHLLKKYPYNPIALVEAPKTAIYCSLYFGLPSNEKDLLWLAVYNKSSFKEEKLQVLKGRFVYVYPDLSEEGTTFEEWKEKASIFETKITGTRFITSDFLERYAPNDSKAKGKDIADFLIETDWKLYRAKKEVCDASDANDASGKHFILEKKEAKEAAKNVKNDASDANDASGKHFILEKNKKQKPEAYTFPAFEALPTSEVKLNQCAVVVDASKFIESHKELILSNLGRPFILPYQNRINHFKNIYESTKNASL